MSRGGRIRGSTGAAIVYRQGTGRPAVDKRAEVTSESGAPVSQASSKSAVARRRTALQGHVTHPMKVAREIPIVDQLSDLGQIVDIGGLIDAAMEAAGRVSSVGRVVDGLGEAHLRRLRPHAWRNGIARGDLRRLDVGLVEGVDALG